MSQDGGSTPSEPDVLPETIVAPGNRRRRVGWTAIDQALSSITNFGIGVVVAREATASEFGSFSVAFTTYLLFVGASRALCSDPLLVRFSATTGPTTDQAVRASTGTALVLSVPLAALCAIGGLAAHGPLRAVLVTLAVLLPGLLIQDAFRFAFMALGSPAKAAANDFMWAVGQAAAFFFIYALFDPSPALLLAAWGGAATLAGIAGPLQSGLRPEPRRAMEWMRSHADLGGRYLLDFFGMVGSVQLTIYGVGLITGLAAAGSLRAAWIVLGPLNVLFFAALSAAVPEGARMTTGSTAGLRRMCGGLAVALPALALAWVAVLVLLPDRFGQAVLGQSWTGARDVLPVLGLALAVNGVLVAADSGLRALGNARRGLRARLFMLPLTAAGGLIGAVVAGAHGAATGLLIADVLGGGIWWYQFNGAVREWVPTPVPVL